MATLTDRLTLSLLDDAFVSNLLANQIGLARLFRLGWELEAGTVHELAIARLGDRQFQLPVFQSVRTRGTEERLAPNPERIRVDYEQPRHGRLEFVDALVPIDLDAVVEDRATPVRQITAQDLLTELGNPATLPDLRAALTARYGADVTGRLLDALHVVSIEELRGRGLTLTIESEPAPPFDLLDPANRRRFPLTLCLSVVPQLEPAAALREAKVRRVLISEQQPAADEVAGAELLQPYVFLVLFPDSAAVDNAIPGLTAAEIRTQVRDLFAREEMVAHFLPGL